MEAEVSLFRHEVTPASFGKKPWRPERVMFTRAALDEPFGQAILARVEALDLPVEKLIGNRLVSLKGKNERDTYRRAKRTMGVVVAPPGSLKLQPIPPSADWQFHLAEGCPAHCQYCYLAGSLTGPPAVRVFANLPAILENTRNFEKPDTVQSFEVSCYTDPLGIEHLTGSLAECIRHFGTRPGANLRWVSKFDAVDPLIGLPHHGQTRLPRKHQRRPPIQDSRPWHAACGRSSGGASKACLTTRAWRRRLPRRPGGRSHYADRGLGAALRPDV